MLRKGKPIKTKPSIYSSPQLQGLNSALEEYIEKYGASLNIGRPVIHDSTKIAMLLGFDPMFNIEITNLGLAVRTDVYKKGYVALLSEDFIIRTLSRTQITHITDAIARRLSR
jgi:hypothetical protein